MTGFVNALGIMMFKSQLKHFEGEIILIILGVVGVAIIYLLPKITKVIPAPIISIIVIYLTIFYLFSINHIINKIIKIPFCFLQIFNSIFMFIS